MEKELISVVIPTFNRAEQTIQCVKSVLLSTYQNIEVIVIDNASEDNTGDLILAIEDDRVIYKRLKKNLMAAGGRNAGIKIAQGSYYLFIDSDNLIKENMIEELYRVISSSPKIGMVAPVSLQHALGDVIWTLGSRYSFYTSREIMNYTGKRLDEISDLKRTYETYYSPNIMMYRKSILELTGGFDRKYYIMYEEADLGYRVRQAGYKAYIVSSAITWHMQESAKGENDPLRLLGIGTPSRAYLFARNRLLFMNRFAGFSQKIIFFVLFVHIYSIYYFVKSIQCFRFDIGLAFLRGVVDGYISVIHGK